MLNLVLITSIIKPPNKPLSYTNVRSAYTSDERFAQTKKTIDSVKKIPNSIIFIVECSLLDKEEHDYFVQNSDYFLNLIDIPSAKEDIYSISKSLGEGTMTIYALDYIIKNQINYDSFFKISGRYWLSSSFDYAKFTKDCNVMYISNESISTCLYNIKKNIAEKFLLFLLQQKESMHNCVAYEHLFGIFISQFSDVQHIHPIGYAGYISVTENEYVES